MNLKKTLFILPNLFTISSIFLGIFAIIRASEGTEKGLVEAGIAIIFAIFCDMFDGRVARLTKTQSDFGVQIDSLADMVSFGLAPGFLMYKWVLYQFDTLGIVFAFLFITAGAIRLARFNVIENRQKNPAYPVKKFMSTHFMGLPIPVSAGLVASTIIVNYQLHLKIPNFGPFEILSVVTILSYLMISNIRYRNFKHVSKTRRNLVVILLVLAWTVFLSIKICPSIALLSICLAYILLGLFEELVFYKKRRIEEKSGE